MINLDRLINYSYSFWKQPAASFFKNKNCFLSDQGNVGRDGIPEKQNQDPETTGPRTHDSMTTQDTTRTQDTRRTKDPMTTQDPMRTQGPGRTQDPRRAQDPMKTQDTTRTQDPYYPSYQIVFS